MKKELKDVLHLYLGCRVVTPTGLSTLCNVGILGNDNQKYRVLPFAMSGSVPFDFNNDKPILRPLSDMTYDEIRQYQQYIMSMPIDNIIDAYKINAQQIAYLLSKHFDLFDLIPSGLAIDATTLKETNPAT